MNNISFVVVIVIIIVGVDAIAIMMPFLLFWCVVNQPCFIISMRVFFL